MLLEVWELAWRWGDEDMPLRVSVRLRALAFGRPNRIEFCIAL